MAIIEKDGFKFLDGLNSDDIVIESDRTYDYIEYIKKNKIKSIYFCDFYYMSQDINLLKECNFVESVNINSSEIIDFTGLYYLKNLKNLMINDAKGKVDLSFNTSIEELAMEMNKNISGLELLENIKTLRLWKYRPKSKDLTGLSMLKSLKELGITQSPIVSLKGIGELNKLENLELNYLSKLEYIDEIENNKNTLKTIWFESCRKIKNHDYVSCLTNLEKLSFCECGEINNLNFIKKLANLKYFVFSGTNVIDGNISPCIGLEYVVFTNKKHFSHKLKDLNDKIY